MLPETHGARVHPQTMPFALPLGAPAFGAATSVARRSAGRTLVASGKGGVGTSVIACLTALSESAAGHQVLLVDATDSGGALHHLFGVRPEQGLWTQAHRAASPDAMLIALSDNLTLLPSGPATEGAPALSAAERQHALRRVVPLLVSYDAVVIDGGSRLETISAIVELTAPRVTLVTSADRLALAANYALVKSLVTRDARLPISVVANRHGEDVAAEACEFLRGACAHFLGRSLDFAGAIPDDPCLQAAIGAGMTIDDASDGSVAADAVRAVLDHLASSAESADTDASSSHAAASRAAVPVLPFRRWS